VNYNNAMELEWGKNLGCDFVMKSCYEWIETKLQRLVWILVECVNIALLSYYKNLALTAFKF